MTFAKVSTAICMLRRARLTFSLSAADDLNTSGNKEILPILATLGLARLILECLRLRPRFLEVYWIVRVCHAVPMDYLSPVDNMFYYLPKMGSGVLYVFLTFAL